MAADPRKRQKKLQRKTAKRKEKAKELALRNPTDLRSRLEQAARMPVVHSLMSRETQADGSLGHVLLSREIRPGEFAAALFLVDPWCLGVKSAFVVFRSRADMESMLEGLEENTPMVAVKPEYLRKFVEGAVTYARDLGISPDPDYERVRGIFGNIDAESCSSTFTYGKDGKPFFLPGPLDNPAKVRQIMNILSMRLGADGFNFELVGGEGDLFPSEPDAIEVA
jgi:hypothetical protein